MVSKALNLCLANYQSMLDVCMYMCYVCIHTHTQTHSVYATYHHLSPLMDR